MSHEDIGVHTIGKEQSVPLAKVFEKLHVAFAGKLNADLYDSSEKLLCTEAAYCS